MSGRVAYLLLVACIVLSAWAFAWGNRQGVLAFILYREPKLVAMLAAGSLLLLAIASLDRGRLITAAMLKDIVSRPSMLALLALVGWSALTMAWAEVPANGRYELRQLSILMPLLIVLLAWSRHDSRVPRRACWALVTAIAVATGVGGLQYLGALPLLVPIDPSALVAHPSLMGYKNPMALALVGQIFLLAGLARTVERTAARRALFILAVIETGYLVTLQSRTAYAAFAAGLVSVSAIGKPSTRSSARSSAIAGSTQRPRSGGHTATMCKSWAKQVGWGSASGWRCGRRCWPAADEGYGVDATHGPCMCSHRWSH